ncbi:hypothetical protein V8G54_031052 [Vigna mungo]|uniref:Uncharacterized protein n=1 Tax=Vigna mungo TaxID=3915 RepID=A0AAQ3MXG7_VIGMU
MEEEQRREKGLAVVDKNNIPDQQEQQHQWRMNINNTSDEDDDGSGPLGSGNDEDARTSGNDDEQSKPRLPEVEPATVVRHLWQWCSGMAAKHRAVVNNEAGFEYTTVQPSAAYRRASDYQLRNQIRPRRRPPLDEIHNVVSEKYGHIAYVYYTKFTDSDYKQSLNN